MSIQSQQPPPVLVPGRLNVVGEDHAESGRRRRLERLFCSYLTQNNYYWTEAQFLDLHAQVGIRANRGGQAQPQRNASADLMEYRAVYGVAKLIGKFDELADAARNAADSGNGTAVFAFVQVNLRSFWYNNQKRVVNTWTPTASSDVNTAVQDVYDAINALLAKYVEVMRLALAKNSVGTLLSATGALANGRAAIDALLDPLLQATGVPEAGNAGELANEISKQRSLSMGLVTTQTSRIGVWKIGEGHIQDLLNGTAKVDMSKANFVTMDQFNTAFEAWMRRTREQLLQRKQQILQQQQSQQQGSLQK